ncbi:MAG: DEAD/DEAH box helicase [Pseudomonadota bacterium]
MTASPQTLLANYHALPDLDKTIVRLFSLNIEPLRQDELLTSLEYLKNRKQGDWPINRKEVIPILNRLKAEGLLRNNPVKTSTQTNYQPLIRSHVLLDVLDQGLFNIFSQCLWALRGGSRAHSYNSFYYYTLEQGLFKLQDQLFTKSSFEELNTTITTLNHKWEPRLGDDPILFLLNPSNPVPLLRHCTHHLAIYSYILDIAAEETKQSPEVIDCFVEQYRNKKVERFPLAALIYLLLTGGMEKAIEIINLPCPDGKSFERTVGQALILLVQGNYGAANLLFADILAQLRKITGKRKPALEGIPGLFHILSLLAAGDNANLKSAKDQLDISRKQDLFPPEIARNLLIVVAQQSGLPHEAVHASFDADDLPPLYRFFYYLSLWWADREQAIACANMMVRIVHRPVAENNFTWLTAESASLLATMGKESSKNSKTANELHAQCGTVSFVGAIVPKDKSMQRLHALLALSAREQNQDDGLDTPSEQRLSWVYNDKGYTFVPFLQKLNKNGKWSKGRNVALKNLFDNFESMEGLTDQDRRIARTIVQNRTYYYGYAPYHFEMDKALIAAIDHPSLFLNENDGLQIEIARGELELRILKAGDTLTISLWPEPPPGPTTAFLHRETPTSFKVYQINPKQATLIALLKEELTLPVTATEQVRELAASLSAIVTVHSDVGGGQEVAEIAADPRPHIHLLPFQDGLRAEIFVRPITDGGSWHQPGQGGPIVFGKIEDKRVQARRDLKEEHDRLQQLISACPIITKTQEVDGQYLFPDPAESLELLAQLQQFPDCTLHWPRGQSFSLKGVTSFSNLALKIKKDRDWFAVSGDLQVDAETVLDLQKLIGLLDQATGRFIPLGDGSFLALTQSLQRRLEELRAYSEQNKDGLRFNPLAALALDDLTSAVDVAGDKQWKAHKARLAETVQPSIPSTLTATLREYQAQGFSWLAQLSHWQMGACLADDMGLGKTIQALAAVLLLTPKGPTLVVAPLSVAGNWMEEAARFAPTLQVKVFGQGDRQEMLDGLGPFDLLICSYGLLPVEGERLAAVNWQTVILDEAQAIKNRETKRAKAAMALSAQFRLITTGTPLENHLGELWTLFNFINPGLLGSHQHFTTTFALPIERDKDRKRLQQLQRLIRPFILRRMKSEVLQELPAKTEITLQVEMSEAEAALYEAQRQSALARLEDGGEQGGAQHLQVLVEIMKLRRLCCNPSLVLPEANIASSKLKVFADILTEMLENRHKALVFSQFIDHLSIIRALLDEKKIPYQYLDGSVSAAQRKERIAAFQAGVGEVFLISLKAGGSGLNLTAADYVIHMDPWWNPAVEDQASDRAHRIGQERPVTVYRLVMKGSIEEKIVALHKDKRDLADSLLDGADASGKLNAGELLNLLRDSGGRYGELS